MTVNPCSDTFQYSESCRNIRDSMITRNQENENGMYQDSIAKYGTLRVEMVFFRATTLPHAIHVKKAYQNYYIVTNLSTPTDCIFHSHEMRCNKNPPIAAHHNLM